MSNLAVYDIPCWQLLPWKPLGQEQVPGFTHIPPLRQWGEQIAVREQKQTNCYIEIKYAIFIYM